MISDLEETLLQKPLDSQNPKATDTFRLVPIPAPKQGPPEHLQTVFENIIFPENLGVQSKLA